MNENLKDLTLSIRSDENCSRTVDRDHLAEFIMKLTGTIQESTNDFVLNGAHQVQIHIILDCVRLQGDQLVSCHPAPDTINCIRLLMPAAARTPECDRDCQILAYQIAQHLHWRLHDDSEVNAWLALDDLVSAANAEGKPWWRFWS